MRHGNLLSQVTIATDPVYLTEPYIRSQEFVLMERNNTNWLYNCEYAMEMPRDKNVVPHFLPGRIPWPASSARGMRCRRRACAAARKRCCPNGGRAPSRLPPRPNANGGSGPRCSRRSSPAGEVKAVHVQGNVHMIVGAGANIAVQVGDDGVMVVDTGAAGTSEKVLAAIKALAPDKEIRWIINTTFRTDHTGGNEAIAKAGRTVNGNLAGDHRARERRRADDQGGRARCGPAVQHLSSRHRATSRSTASRC